MGAGPLKVNTLDQKVNFLKKKIRDPFSVYRVYLLTDWWGSISPLAMTLFVVGILKSCFLYTSFIDFSDLIG